MITDLNTGNRFTGRFKGVVANNVDPLQLGRLQVTVPDVLGPDPCIWAESASPLAGPQMGMYFVPPISAGVWVEFQNGDIDNAIWTGCWRGALSDVPVDAMAAPPALPPIVIQTQAQNKVIISSTPGEGITLETAAGELGPRIVITPLGIEISTGPPGAGASIKLSVTDVDINEGALKILAV